MKVRVRMLENCTGSEDHVRVTSYQSGREYVIPDHLARNLIILGVAAPISEGDEPSAAAAPSSVIEYQTKVVEPESSEVLPKRGRGRPRKV